MAPDASPVHLTPHPDRRDHRHSRDRARVGRAVVPASPPGPDRHLPPVLPAGVVTGVTIPDFRRASAHHGTPVPVRKDTVQWLHP